MNKKRLLILSTFIFLITISILFFILINQKPIFLEINQINELYLNKQIQIVGLVKEIKNYNQFQIWTLNDVSSEKTIQITTNSEKIVLISDYKNKTISVTGKLEEYNDKLQIKAYKINILN